MVWADLAEAMRQLLLERDYESINMGHIAARAGLARNTHRLRVEGEFGALRIEVENVPSENPRTGRLSYLSTIALLRDLGAPLRVGT